jgi:3-oxoacyl-ACP reductase-like protein
MMCEADINTHVDALISGVKDFNNFINGKNISVKQIRQLDPLVSKLKYTLKTQIQKYDIRVIEGISKKRKISQYCYICKTKIWDDDMRHPECTDMCILCGNINYSKRDFKKDLSGKIAIVTGGRVKIGFETALRLLRNGCMVVVTSRFIDDCLERYQKNLDFDSFKDRLFIYQLNMLSNNSIKTFVKYIFDNFPKLDYLINNAAQTIKRPKQFYQHVIDKIGTYDDSRLIVHRTYQN